MRRILPVGQNKRGGPPMTLDESVSQTRLRVIVRAQQIGNVAKACREFGISRSLFYRWRKRYLAYGPDGLHPGHAGARRVGRRR